MPDVNAPAVAYRTCPLCEATCGLEITVAGGKVVRIRGDRDDVLSHGYLCPKGSALKQLHDDPDRLRAPLVRRDGVHVQVSWREAFAEVDRLLTGVIARHGRDAVAVYLGNPNVHNLSGILYDRYLLGGLGTRQRYSASTADQMPKQVASAYLFGTPASVAVPDLDRTDHLLILGANPYASNGSLCTAPDFPGRIDAIRERGGKVVVVDPKRTRTAEAADEWVPLRPGADAHLLAAMVTTLFDAGLADPGDHVRPHLDGLDAVRRALAPFTPDAVATRCGIEGATIRRLALELAGAPTAAVYGRIGTCTQEFGTTASWLVDVLNIVSGNLDRPGGAMWTLPATGGPTVRGTAGRGTGFRVGRGSTRVRGLSEVMGEYPVAALAEEIDTPGPGQLRALVTVAGNPVLSTPDATRLDVALEGLEAVVAVDIYLNETTRHADVILPPPSPLHRGHYDVALLPLAVRNVANYSAPVLPLPPDQPDEWEILVTLAAIAQGFGPELDPAVADDRAVASLVRAAVSDAGSPVHGRDPDELVTAASAGGRRGPERLLDVMLRTGPYGDAFGARRGGLTLDALLDAPHGIDLGPLQARLPEVLRTPTGRIEMSHPVLLADVERLQASLAAPGGGDDGRLVLVGRRHVRSNNSWMHNIDVLVKGKGRCTVQIHPDDAARAGVRDGGLARVSSTTGHVDLPVEVTDAMRPGVVSVPHGWGHDRPGTSMRVARAVAGVNANVLVEARVDPLSGNAVLSSVPVRVGPVSE